MVCRFARCGFVHEAQLSRYDLAIDSRCQAGAAPDEPVGLRNGLVIGGGVSDVQKPPPPLKGRGARFPWFHELATGKSGDRGRDRTAREPGQTLRQSRIPLAFLASSIVDAFSKGTQPPSHQRNDDPRGLNLPIRLGGQSDLLQNAYRQPNGLHKNLNFSLSVCVSIGYTLAIARKDSSFQI
jgi:hypothetical protein